MSLKTRLKNAYETNGIKEIIRKTFFHFIYKTNGVFTRIRVNAAGFKYGLNLKDDRKVKVIVSLTSYPKRFASIVPCLKSLLLQNYKPDRLIVYLGSDTKKDDITPEMKKLEKYGVEYRIDDEHNYGSHKKYYYALREFPDSIVITADDDLYYPKNWIKTMIKTHEKYPDCVICRRTHLIRKDENGIFPYNYWIDQNRSIKTPTYSLLGTSGSGKLYPPHSICETAFDADKFTELCFSADDVWIKCMEVLSKRKSVWAKNWKVDLLNTRGSQEESLESVNVNQCENDVCLKKTMDAYGIKPEDFFKD